MREKRYHPTSERKEYSSYMELLINQTKTTWDSFKKKSGTHSNKPLKEQRKILPREI